MTAADRITACLSETRSRTMREIAYVTGLPWETVRSTVHRHSCFGERYTKSGRDPGMLYTQRRKRRCRVTGRRAATWALMLRDVVWAAVLTQLQKQVEQQLTDVLPHGWGFAKQTSFPPKLKHVPYSKVIRTEDVV